MQIFIPALTYNGSVLDTALNICVLAVVIAPFVGQSRSLWWITLLVMVELQVALWLALNATGISVVWAGLAGAVIVDRVAARRGTGQPVAASGSSRLSSVTIGVAIAAIAYYAVTLPPISTVAHLLAVGVGAAVHALVRTVERRESAPTAGPFRLPERVHHRMLERWPEYHASDRVLTYDAWGEAGLRISLVDGGYCVERRADRSNVYGDVRFWTRSRRDLCRRLLRE